MVKILHAREILEAYGPLVTILDNLPASTLRGPTVVNECKWPKIKMDPEKGPFLHIFGDM